MTVADLKNRMIVETRNGERYIVIDDMLLDIGGYIDLSYYNCDLCYRGNKRDWDIMVVYDCVYNLSVLTDRPIRLLVPIWKREEVKKLTLKEIEDRLGYPVEIIEEG